MRSYILLLVILVISFGLRLYKFTSPVADWHSWRQVDTAAVARNFIRIGFTPLLPKYDDLSNIQTGHDNPEGLRLVEFPVFQLIGASLYSFGGGSVPIESALRIVAVGASVATVALLFFLVRAYVDSNTALIAAALYGVLPYSIYYGRTLLPDGFMVFLAVLTIYVFHRAANASDTKKAAVLFIFGSCSGALTLLCKPTGVFLLLPLVWILLKQKRKKIVVLGISFFSGLGIVIPLIAWRMWIAQYPEGIPAYTWLLNQANIRFKGAWFYWLFSQRIGSLILGYWGLVPLGIGLVVSGSKKEGWIFRLWIIGVLLYMAIIAGGNVQHDYYQILLLPVLSVYVAKGFMFLLRKNHNIDRIPGFVLACMSLGFLWGFSWYTIRTYYWINRPEIVEAGKHADRLLPKDAKVIAPYNGDTTFLYQTNRQGWPIGFEIEKKIAQGATHYVTVSPTDNDFETKTLAETYTVLVRNDTYAIIDLTKPINSKE